MGGKGFQGNHREKCKGMWAFLSYFPYLLTLADSCYVLSDMVAAVDLELRAHSCLLKTSTVNILSSPFTFLPRLKSVIYVHCRSVYVLTETSCADSWGEYVGVTLCHSATQAHISFPSLTTGLHIYSMLSKLIVGMFICPQEFLIVLWVLDL